MATDLRFLKGTAAKYNQLKQAGSIDNDTFYYVTDAGAEALYLGELPLSLTFQDKSVTGGSVVKENNITYLQLEISKDGVFDSYVKIDVRELVNVYTEGTNIDISGTNVVSVDAAGVKQDVETIYREETTFEGSSSSGYGGLRFSEAIADIDRRANDIQPSSPPSPSSEVTIPSFENDEENRVSQLESDVPSLIEAVNGDDVYIYGGTGSGYSWLSYETEKATEDIITSIVGNGLDGQGLGLSSDGKLEVNAGKYIHINNSKKLEVIDSELEKFIEENIDASFDLVAGEGITETTGENDEKVWKLNYSTIASEVAGDMITANDEDLEVAIDETSNLVVENNGLDLAWGAIPTV